MYIRVYVYTCIHVYIVYCIFYIVYCILHIAYCILYIEYCILYMYIVYVHVYVYMYIIYIYTYTGIVEGIYEKMIALLLVGRLRIARGFP